jgi:hypothetical protein
MDTSTESKNTQIALVGGQTIPVYVGAKEFDTQKLILIHTKQTKTEADRLKNTLKKIKIESHEVSPYDFESTYKLCKDLVDENSKCNISLNLTSGSKIMALASFKAFDEQGLVSFSINQTGDYVNLKDNVTHQLGTKLTLKEFMTLSGHKDYKTTHIDEIVVDDVNLSKELNNIFKNNRKLYRGFMNSLNPFRAKGGELPIAGGFPQNKPIIRWNKSRNEVTINAKKYSTARAIDILINGMWLEIVTALEVKNRTKNKEIYLSTEINTRSSDSSTGKRFAKNEIDVLVNQGDHMVLIECKTGYFGVDVINKMRTSKNLYGGTTAKSVLVSIYRPQLSAKFEEQCREFNISTYYLFDENKKYQGLHTFPSTLKDLSHKIQTR